MPKGEKKNDSSKSGRKGRSLTSVNVPKDFLPIFEKAQDFVSKYFKEKKEDPSKGTIEIFGERYILVRSASMSIDFFESVKNLYKEEGEEKAINVARNLLFDIAHAIGRADARNFHEIMKLKNPIEKLSAGPVHFSHSGWAFVDIFPESRPSPDENYYLIYDHPFSFESDAWLKAGKRTDFPVCVMNAGYSSGWCEESFGVTLVASEITCKAKGDENCRFIMAPPSRIEGHIKSYLKKEPALARRVTKYDIPGFFKRKQVEKALIESEDRYRTLVEEAGDGIIMFDTDAEITFVNKYLLDLGGYRKEEVIGHDFTEFVPEEFLPIALKMFQDSFQGIESPATEIELKAKGGKLVPVGYKGSIIYENGEMTGIRAIIRDNTERKKAEEELNRYKEHLEELVVERTAELKESEENLRGIFSAMADMLFVFDDKGAFTFYHAFDPQILYRPPEKFIGKAYTEVMPPSLHDMFSKAFRKNKKNKIVNIEYSLDIDGKEMWFDGKLSPMFSDGKFKGSVAVVRDITKRKKTERELHESEERFRRMAENIHDGLAMKENDKVVYLNERACEIFGYPRDELVNMTDIDLAAPGEKERLKQIIEETGKKGVSPGEIEFWIVRKDGTRRYIRNRYSMSRDGGVTDRFVITTDITERKLVEDERRRRLMRFLLEDGNLYLVKEREPTLSIEAFSDLLKIGYEGTVISRTPKKNLKRSIDYYFDLYWLGEGAGKGSISPTLEDLELRIDSLKGNNVVLIDRLDYLIFKNGFKNTLSFVYRLRDIAYLRELVIILSIDPTTVKEEELNLLEKETRGIEPQNVPRPGEDVFDIVELIFEKNNTGVKPSYTQIGTELGISKPTSRKRIRRLVAAGYVVEIVKGNRKILELTQKGRSLFFK